jgi:hypothetical protein
MNEDPCVMSLSLPPVKKEIYFNAEAGKWVLKLTKEGVVFNRELYPNSTPEDFVKSFIDILEGCYDIKFHRKEPPYDIS